MTAKRVSKVEVFNAAERITETGEKPSVKTVHNLLGRGTTATVEKYLNQWYEEEQKSESTEAIPDAFLELAEELYKKTLTIVNRDNRQRDAAASAKLKATSDINDKLTAQIKQMEKQLSSQVEEHEKQLSEQAKEFTSQKKDAVNALANLQKEYDEKLTHHTREYEQEIAKLSSELEEKLASKTGKYEEHVNHQSHELQETKSALKQMKAEAESNKSKLAAKDEELNKLLKEHNEIQTEITKRELRIRELALEKDKLRAENQKLSAACSEKDTLLETATSEINRLKEQNVEALANATPSGNDEIEHEMNALKLANKELESSLSRRVDLKDNELNWAKEELEEKQKEIVALNKTASEASVRYQTLEHIKKRLTNEITNLNNNLDEVNNQNAKMVQKLASLEKTVLEYSVKIRTLEGKTS